jgi:hypothetical protein
MCGFQGQMTNAEIMNPGMPDIGELMTGWLFV